MTELYGINLAEKQKELNIKINDAANKKINFNEIKSHDERTDIDKLYKIGVASKYKDVEYIMEILKSGDTLYITKALKSIWLYSNEYSNIINPEYLHENIFPFMSLKMTKIFLTTISMNVRDEKRAGEFYTYCYKFKLTEIAIKFAMFTSESFKLELLKDNNLIDKLRESEEFTRLFLGNSFDLAEAYYDSASEYNKGHALYQLRHFYFISNVKYLEMLSKSNCHINNFNNKIGLRISKDIIKKHKDKIYKNPILYLHFLNKNMLVRYSTVDDAKFYAKTLITHECLKPKDFWNKNLCDTYDYIFDKIPPQERLLYVKNIFNKQHPEEEFELCIEFYNTGLYKWMIPEEREKWALRHIESELELLGSGKDFMWYRFVSFDIAFKAIKKYVMVAVNTDTRKEIVTVLAESAKTESELEILFDYYYKRHVNEQHRDKEYFVDAIVSKHDVYNFSKTCWDAFNKILFSLNVYDSMACNYYKNDYKYIALIYHIIHSKEVPEALIKSLDLGIYFYTFKKQTGKLPKEKEEIVYGYLLKFYLDKIKLFDKETYNDEVKHGVQKYINFILDMMNTYEKSKEDIPEIVIRYIKLDIASFRHYQFTEKLEAELTQQSLIYHLKKDKQLLISKLPLLKDRIINSMACYKLNTFLKILKTYFSNDLTSVFLKLFKDILGESNPHFGAIKTAVYGILEIGDSDLKKEFLSEHVPKESKIDYSQIDRNNLYIQESICNMACYGRPPLPLSDIMSYIKGDYVHFCLPMFNSYITIMPKPLCIEFVKSLLDTPLSVQKHGLRMAFKCFSVQDLRKVILDVWEKTKNVSLRSVIYTSIFNKIIDVDKNAQNDLFKDLISFTNSLTGEDDEKIFMLLTSDRLPQRFIGEYLEVAWNVINKLPEKKIFIGYRRKVIDCMESNIYLINKQVVEAITYDHVNLFLKQEKDELQDNDQDSKYYLISSKCALFLKYVSFFIDDDDFTKKTDLIMFLIKECLIMWNKVEGNKEYVFKKILSKFIIKLNDSAYEHEVRNYTKTNIIFEQILKKLQDTLPNEEIYQILWKIRICIITRKVIINEKQNLEHNTNHNIIIKEAFNTYAKEFASLLIKSIEDRNCYVSFFNDIQNALSFNLRLVLIDLNYKDDLDIGTKNAYVDICLQVLDYKSFETYMFALKLLPRDISQCTDRK